jgi:outer membrane cobalamin receptor
MRRAGALTWHASYTRVTQVPTYTALKSNPAAGLFRGNQSLGRESSRQVEIGLSGSHSGWTVEGAIFWRHDDSLVDWTFARGVTARTANPLDIDTAGLEMVARRSWRWTDIVLGYTGLIKNADYRLATVDASFYALNYAKHRVTLAATVRMPANVELRIDNSVRWQAENLLRTTGGDRTVLTTATIAWHPSGRRGLECTLTVDNAWNSSFQEVPGTPAPRRQAMGGLSYHW